MDFSAPPSLLSDTSDDESLFGDAYFYNTYVPLSNLPTPPLGKASSVSKPPAPRYALTYENEYLEKEYLGAAILLTNLIPLSSSPSTPSLPLVHAILTRADLPSETIALAICILDSLTCKFGRTWRRNCPLPKSSSASGKSALPGSRGANRPQDSKPSQERAPSSSNCGSKSQPQDGPQQQHIDSVKPEIIALCAIILAVKYVDDTPITTLDYATEWGRGMWTCEQINFTEWTLFENLKFQVLALYDEKILKECMMDMERAGLDAAYNFGDDDERPGCGADGNDDMAWMMSVETLTPPYTPLEFPQYLSFDESESMTRKESSIEQDLSLMKRKNDTRGMEFITSADSLVTGFERFRMG
ncbi:hypothetical protein F5884DRAFT_859321 [Xylogone sp. PMI_703]|nr:hypothetical protein F5884DRAFT_859321 [Xylogone sp. PMI_703]